MLAAGAVLVSHAWPISYGRGWAEPLESILPGQSLGRIAVLIFFAISGFFIAQSFDRQPSLARFITARGLRVFPALVVMLTVTLLAAALISDDPVTVLEEGPAYLIGNLTLVSLHQVLPGVFEDTPFGPTMNGSLWTLVYEVACYAMLAVAGLMGLFSSPRRRVLCLLALAVLALSVLALVDHPRILRFLDLGLPFALGAALYLWRDRVRLNLPLALTLLGICLLVRGSPVFPPLLAVALAYGVITIGFMPRPRLFFAGDYSYGIYIYAFPIQQLGASLGYQTPLANIAFALPLTVVCAILSWHLVERPALGLKTWTPRQRAAVAR